MRKIVLTFGLIAGAILSAMMTISFVNIDRIGFDKAEIIGYTTLVIAFLMVFFGIKSYRDNVGGGTITFGRAFKVGLLITLVASFCYVATWQVFYYKFAPDFVAKFAAYELDKAKKKGATEAELAEQKKMVGEFMELYKNPFINAAITLIEPVPVGLLVTLLSAWGLSRRRGKNGPAIA